ncbi:MAG: class I SAM-dependent methyltransferase [Solirubrobacterales bacterium]|nr:class I SAM-dependent methyltransferase [Solirubrobacterales bacterium]
MYEESIRGEFTHQTDAFASAAVMSAAETLGALVELVPVEPEARWLEVACGPAAVSRALAARVGSIHGVDLTPAMVEKAAAAAEREGIANAEFSVGDATALDFEDAGFDGAVTRFSLHHIPAPQRVLAEMARVVRPGGWVIVGDHVTDADGDAAAWHEQIERLRDPSHWACLTPDRLQAMAEAAGLRLDLERLIPFDLDFDEWLQRGSGGPGAAELINRLLAEAPDTADCFRVVAAGEGRRLALHNCLTRWRV